MNRTIAYLILGVIVLAMALIMVNQYMSPPAAPVTAESSAARTEGGQGNAFRADATQPPMAPQAAPQTPPQAAPQAPSASMGMEPRLAVPPVPATPQAPATTAQTPGMPAWAGPPTDKGTPGGAAGVLPSPGAVSTASTASAPAVPAATAGPEATPPHAATGTPAPSASTPPPAPAKAAAPKPAPAKPKGPKTVQRIAVSAADGGSLVRISASEALEYKTMQLKDPERVVVDLAGVWAIKAPGVPANKYVTNVRIGKQSDKTRIVIDLRQTPQGVNFVKRGADTLEVRIK